MNSHLSSMSKSLLFVANATMEASRQFNRQSWNQSVGSRIVRLKQMLASSSMPFHFRHKEPTKAAKGIKKIPASTAVNFDHAQIESGTP